MASSLAVIGAQWGDEGKGKIIDALSENTDIVVRFNGGNNAGHTVKIQEREFKLHLLPSGILRKGKRNLIASGVVIDPEALVSEMELIEKSGFSITEKNLGIDFRCHLVMPWHIALDKERVSSAKIGTTGRGIGPCYESKAARTGMRFCDLIDEKRLRDAIEKSPSENFGTEKLISEYSSYGRKLKKFGTDVSAELNASFSKSKKILFEGAQGTFLDNNFGTYPFVTSSNCIAGSASVSAGISPSFISRVEGVVKAYTTRVGNGPFPTELFGKDAENLREKGKEYGATTGRARRVGWVDIPMLKTSSLLNGFNGIHLTKLDVLSGLEEIKICVSYSDKSGNETSYFPLDFQLQDFFPKYVSLPGFEAMTGEEWADIAERGKKEGLRALPKNARNYVEKIVSLLKVPAVSVSIGPEREETIWLK